MACALCLPHVLDAQAPAQRPPGPYVVDLHGAMSGIPSAAPFYPPVPTGTTIASRGFGFDVGGHVLPLRLGGARLGVGASLMRVRGTATGTSATLQVLAPQISFNFGSADGWSYLSVGLGTARVRTEATAPATAPTATAAGAADAASTTIATAAAIQETTRKSPSVSSLNAGGGARWFVTSHLAVGFDVRLYRLAAGSGDETHAATPRTTLVAASVGLSVR